VVILNGVRDAVRDGDLDPLAALEAVCAAVLTEPSEVVLRSVLRSAQDEWVAVFTRAERRSDRTRDVNAAAERILASAEPGSDRQLAALRIAVHSSDDAAKLSRWWEGRLPSGVAADPELTWALVQRMSELSADVGVLDKALAQDPSASARVHAARARAALPTTATKEAAWELLMQPSAASAYEVYATAEGFFQPTQTALTTPFVPMFFAQIVDTAQFRTGWSLGRTAKLAYPLSHTSAETLELAERTLRDRAMPEAIRRALVDQTDQLRRAVVSQERFAAGTQ
jgi:aminopeptidase N